MVLSSHGSRAAGLLLVLFATWLPPKCFQSLQSQRSRVLLKAEGETKEMSPALKMAMERMAAARAKEEDAERQKEDAEEREKDKVRREEEYQRIFDESPELSLSLPDPKQAASVAQALFGQKVEGIQIGMETAQEGQDVKIKGLPISDINYKLYGTALGEPRRFYLQSNVKTSPLGIVWVDDSSTIVGFFVLFTSEHPPTDDELASVQRVAESKANADDPDQMLAGIPKRWIKFILQARGKAEFNMKNWGNPMNQLFKKGR